jgi:hypothetical protein
MIVLAACVIFTISGQALAGDAAAPVQSPAPIPSQSPAPAPRHVIGTIISFDGKTLNIKLDSGEMVAATVLPTTLVLFNEHRSISDLHAGDFVGSAALTGADGKLHAQEVRVFPEKLRGMGEGQYPMGDNNPNRSMTNATISEVTAISSTGGVLKLKFHGASAAGVASCTGHAARDGMGCEGETEISVAPGVPIMAYAVGDISALVPGAAVSALVAPAPDGTWQTPRLLVEHNGLKPV